jgi:hypothetical protein
MVCKGGGMKIDLHIFTNCTPSSPSTVVIRETYASFCATFGAMPATVWCDPNPRATTYPRYLENLHKTFKDVKKCNSLSDGYIKAIKASKADYLFMLEHDWRFNTKLVRHSLLGIMTEMEKRGIYHLRFNKRKNAIAGWDKEMTEMGFFCRTNILSNNPHIINRKKYHEFIARKYIQVKPGSKGIEEIISAQLDTWGGIYGPMNYPACVCHIDGRRRACS